jgi:hypothetical protein
MGTRSRREKTPDRTRQGIPNKRFRTRLANGTAVLEGIDGRSYAARRYRELGALITRDIAPDPDMLTEAQRQLIRSAAGLVVLRERLDVEAANDRPIDYQEYCTISNSLRRVLATIGLRRIPREINGETDERKLSRILGYIDGEAEQVSP